MGLMSCYTCSMVAPLPQEKNYQRELHLARLAALRGDSFGIPAVSEQEEMADATRFVRPDSEEGLVEQYPQDSPSADDPSLRNPADFSFYQRQARRAAGVGAPSLLAPEIEALPDPDASMEEDEITYAESLRALEQEAQEAENLEEAQAAGGALRAKMQQAQAQYADQLQQFLKEKTTRWTAKGIGNGVNALDSVGWDGWITFIMSYFYLMARGCVTIFSPEPSDPANAPPSQKALHAFIPPYRPLQEPGDFLYFLFLFVMSLLIVVALVTFAILLLNVVLFPAYLPGLSPSTAAL